MDRSKPQNPKRNERLVVRPSEPADIYALARAMRAEDRAEVADLGLEPRIAVRQSFRAALMRRTAFIDGEIAAMWGVCGAMLSDEGFPYLLTTAAVERMPLAVVRCARAEVREMLEHRDRLTGYVAASYGRACRMLELIGFTLGEPEPIGRGGALFRSYRIER